MANCNQNPCRISQQNTAACESLPSQISNFTTQFFGEIVKTEIDGVVSWSLPCSLDVGLPNNPRAFGEGLACYFLRLFDEGIVGLTGPTGPRGAAGCNGLNAFTITIQGFQQVAIGQGIQVLTGFNPAMLAGSYVFIGTSGVYLINNADASGLLSLTLVSPPVSPIGSTISAGKLVVPSSPGGPIGPQGIQGIQGPMGATGPTGSIGATGATGSPAPQGQLGNSVEFPLTNILKFVSAQHNLGSVPDLLIWTAVCTTNDGDYVVGDELDINAFSSSFTTGGVVLSIQTFAPWKNATRFGVGINTSFSDGVAIPAKETGGSVTVTRTSWKLKGRAVMLAPWPVVAPTDSQSG